MTTDSSGVPASPSRSTLQAPLSASIANAEVQIVDSAEAAKFWAELFPGGITDEQLKAELADYYFMLEQVPKVYCEVTGGLLSKTNYYANTVVSAFNDYLNDRVEEEVADRLDARGIDSGEDGEPRSGSTPQGQEPGAAGTRPDGMAAQGEAPPPSVPAAKPDAGHPLLQALVDSIEVFQGSACWDYMAMYAVRDALAAAPPPEQAQPAVPALTDEREAFEAWADDQGFPLKRLDIGDGEDYLDLRTQGAWDTWQARAALATPPAQVEQPALTEAWCHPARQALEWAENALATKSRDVDDWADDMHLIAKMLRSALTRKDSHG